jgi:hypothetical protein
MGTCCLTQLHPSSDVAHPKIHFLRNDDIFLDSQDESEVVQHTTQNDPKTWLLRITTRGDRLSHNVIAVLFMA